ncbi:MFS transporter, partial [Salmonella enterica subsp. enterica serovar Kentucky]|nr:MFS transporter [Salmonella enterica subsp. enterica serovar Kentucky]
MYTPLNWTTTQRHVAFASFTSWMLDAFDFFILVFVLSDLAEWF